MAVKKKRVTQKTKKEIVKKKKVHKGSPSPEVKHDAPMPTPPPISESVGGPAVIPSGVLQDIPKENSQSQAELPKVEPPVSVLRTSPQPIPQTADTQVSQPEPATNSIPSVEPIATQDPFAVNGVVRDKPDEEHIEDPKKNKLWIIIVIIIIIVILIGGVLWYFRENAVKQVTLEDKIRFTPAPSRISPTPASDSAKLKIDYSKYKIQVLNGSGVAGAAAKGKGLLEEEKFVVEEISNAETSDYDMTIIKTKKEVPTAFLDKLKIVLEKTYRVAPKEELEGTEDVDIIVIIGSSQKP